MRMTVVTTEEGELLAAAFGDIDLVDPDGPEWHGPGTPVVRAGLVAGTGQRLQVVDVPQELVRVESTVEFHRLLTEHVHGAKG